MNKFLKIAALGAAVCVIAASLFGCNDASINESYTAVKAGVDNAVATEKGELLVHESLAVKKNVGDKLQSGSTETHIRYGTEGVGTFELTRTGDGDATEYVLIKGKDIIFETVGGSGKELESVDIDIFEKFRMDYTEGDIAKAVTEKFSKGVTVHTLTMKSSYADKLDNDENGVKYDCTDVVISYTLDAAGALQKVVSEITYTVAIDGEAQKAVKAIDAQIEA